jgi:hypothetical protein
VASVVVTAAGSVATGTAARAATTAAAGSVIVTAALAAMTVAVAASVVIVTEALAATSLREPMPAPHRWRLVPARTARATTDRERIDPRVATIAASAVIETAARVVTTTDRAARALT